MADVANEGARVDAVGESREDQAIRVVNSYLGWTAGAGLVPMPGVDIAAVTLVQLKMLDSLARVYHVPFRRNAAKSIIGVLIGGLAPFSISAPVASLVKVVPVVGSVLGAVILPSLAAASTYALGKVFIQHFESGGTFLDMDPDKVSAYFKEQYEYKRSADASADAKKAAKVA